MRRREFCKLTAATVAAHTILAKGQTAPQAAAGFNSLHQTYAKLCATPESQRVFYAQLKTGQPPLCVWDGGGNGVADLPISSGTSRRRGHAKDSPGAALAKLG